MHLGSQLGITPVTAVARQPNHLDLFAVGLDGGIWSTWWDANADNGHWDHGWFHV